MSERRRRMLGELDPRRCSGMEIGALHAPTVRRSEGRIVYVDFAPTEVLRAGLRHPGVDPSELVEVDLVWGGQALREMIDAPVDYVVASHVIEHVPDLIGWLLELHGALRRGGVLGLAVPDRRATFDTWRHDSLLGEMVEARLDRRRRPSPRQVFEAAAFSRNGPHAGEWREGDVGLPAEVSSRLPEVFRWVREEVAQVGYVDVHCWVFTPASFLEMAASLSVMGCFPFVVDGFYPTEPGAIEFLVRLRSCAEGDPAVRASIDAARMVIGGGGGTQGRYTSRRDASPNWSGTTRHCWRRLQ